MRACLTNRRFVIFLCRGQRGAFTRGPEQTVAQNRTGGIVGEAATTLGLVAKMKGLFAIGLTRDAAGARFRALSRRRLLYRLCVR
jgi:hypothetical protein